MALICVIKHKRDGVFYIPVLMIYAIILSVIVAPTNSQRTLGERTTMTLFGTEFRLDELWGKASEVRRKLGI